MVFSKGTFQQPNAVEDNGEQRWGKQLGTKETIVQFGMPPYVKDDTVERKLSTKPNQYTEIRKSAQAVNSSIRKKYTGSMDTKVVLQSQELCLENVEVLASRSN